MTRRERVRHQHGQGALEYAVLFMAVILVIVFGQVYFKRALSGRFKDTSDQIGEQFTTGRNYTTQTIQQSFRRERTAHADLDQSNGVYSESKVLKGDAYTGTGDFDSFLDELGAKGGTYGNAEATVRDFVNATAGAGNVGIHSYFDSGDLRSANLFNE